MLHIFTNGLLGSNAYLVWNQSDSQKPGFLLDLGVAPEEVQNFCTENGITLRYLILSHGHYDHAHYLAAYQTLFPEAVVLCHADEAPVLCDPIANVSEMCGVPTVYPMPKHTLADGDFVTLGEGEQAICWQVLHTPGHTPGSICLYNEAEKVILTGDTLFGGGGFGRYDFKYGDVSALGQSLKRLLTMDGDCMIYPGHGAGSTIRAERSTLAYFT